MPKPPFKDPRGHSIRIYSDIYDSPAFKSLTPTDVMAYLALRRDLKGSNNGDLSLTLARAKTRGINHHMTLARSLRALCAVGLICLTRKGGTQRGGQRLPSLYGMTDVDIYAMPQKQVEARKADDAWRKVTTEEQGRSLIEQAEDAVKKASAKLKNLGHAVTVTRTSRDMKTATTRTSRDTWTDRPGHLVTHGKNSVNLIPMRVTDGFSGADYFQNHRARRVSPIHIATPGGGMGANSDTDAGIYHRLTTPMDGRGWLPAGLVDRVAVPEAVTRKARKHLAKLPMGAHDAVAIQAGRAAGLSIEQLSAWADPDTVAGALAAGCRPWRDLWTHTSLEVQT